MLYVCFFKQKTAYEMRMSDWSSDVCSSELGRWNKEISLYIVASVRRQLFLDTQFLLLQTCKECRIRQRSALFRLDTFIQASMLGLKSCNMAVLHIYSPS